MEIRPIIQMLDDPDKSIDVRLYFTRKRINNRYTSFSPSIEPELQKELVKIVRDALAEVVDKEQRNYSPEGTIDGVIEHCAVNGIDSFQEILRSMDEDVAIRRPITSEEIKKLNFYCLKIYIDNAEEMLIFRRVTKFNRLSKGMVGFFVNNDFKKLESDLLGIDKNIDLLVKNNEVLVMNHIALERIFSVQEQFVGKATETLNIVERSNRITNFDQFREDCLGNARIVRALTKILENEERVQQCFENFENVIQVVDIFELDINFEEGNNAIIYEDKSQLLDITRLIRDSFYRSLINSREGIDEGI